MNILDFTLGAITLAVGIIAKPYIDIVVMRLKRLFTQKKHTIEQHNLEVIVERMNELEKRLEARYYDAELWEAVEDLGQQINNVAEVKYRRETNRKNNIRREVRDYLKELRSDK
jgi:hypothetical protein